MQMNRTDILKDLSILYVEDDIEISNQSAAILGRFFNKVYPAENGKHGLELFRTYSPDLVMTDISMPLMNGMDMAKTIRNLSPRTPIVVVTAHNEEKYLYEGIGIGIERFILKPVDIEILLNALVDQAAKIIFNRGIL